MSSTGRLSVSENRDVSVVGRGARIEGSLISGGGLTIYGHVTGAITVEGEVTVLPESVIEADIKAGSISLGGRVKGDLTAPGVVSLPKQSQVEGDVEARSVIVHGIVDGDVRAAEKVQLGPEARLNGDITCRLLVVDEGAVFRGRSTMGEQSP
jgi:cytoskeletal protein CcmA (bactofilin family)